jgi:hypothetical protein
VKAYEAIVKGENIAEPSIPESFKVLLKEMQSLALDVHVLSEEGAHVEVREEDDELLRAAEELGIDLSPGSLARPRGSRPPRRRRRARSGRRGGRARAAGRRGARRPRGRRTGVGRVAAEEVEDEVGPVQRSISRHRGRGLSRGAEEQL